MKIAFYAPMNSPEDGRTSGDRMIAQQIMNGLRHLGHEVELASTFKTWTSEPEALDSLRKLANEEIARLNDQKYDAWLTYHNYYKAPDLLGPDITKAQGIPYFIAEASISPKRQTGPWAEHSNIVQTAIENANHIFSTCPRDLPALEAAGVKNITALRPWINPDEWKSKHLPHEGGVRLHTTAMMRAGDKMESYRVLALALEELDVHWSLTIAGDGPEKDRVDLLLLEFGPRINFTGSLEPKFLKMTYTGADIFVWPGIGEGLGFVYLEAMAAGLPVVAVDGPGVRGVLNDKVAVLTDDSPEGFAAGIEKLFDPDARKKYVRAARNHVEDNHSQDQFIAALKEGLEAGGIA